MYILFFLNNIWYFQIWFLINMKILHFILLIISKNHHKNTTGKNDTIDYSPFEPVVIL